MRLPGLVTRHPGASEDPEGKPASRVVSQHAQQVASWWLVVVGGWWLVVGWCEDTVKLVTTWRQGQCYVGNQNGRLEED